MSKPAPQLVQKRWNYCIIFRYDGLSFGDYVEQLTFMPFLKMGDEQSRARFDTPSALPKDYVCLSLVDDLESVVSANLPRGTRLHQKAFPTNSNANG